MDITADDRDQVLLKIIEEDTIEHGTAHLGGTTSTGRSEKYWSEKFRNFTRGA